MELVVRVPLPGQRADRARDGERDDPLGDAGRRLPLRQPRRLLDGTDPPPGSAATRPGEVPARHPVAGRLRARPGDEAGDLRRRGTAHVHALSGQPPPPLHRRPHVRVVAGRPPPTPRGPPPFARPGAWNDPDMLQVGNRGLTATEGWSMFSLWSIMAAPLIVSTDLRTMSRATRRTLTNREVIRVDQDAGGVQGFRASSSGGQEVWVRPLANGDRALLLFNRSAGRATVGADARQLGLRPSGGYVVRDLWAHRTSSAPGPITASLPR